MRLRACTCTRPEFVANGGGQFLHWLQMRSACETWFLAAEEAAPVVLSSAPPSFRRGARSIPGGGAWLSSPAVRSLYKSLQSGGPSGLTRKMRLMLSLCPREVCRHQNPDPKSQALRTGPSSTRERVGLSPPVPSEREAIPSWSPLVPFPCRSRARGKMCEKR